MKTALIMNPSGGRGRAISLLPSVTKWCGKQNIEFRLYPTSTAGDGTRLARMARMDGCDRIVVLGGDGTVNEVGQAIAGSEIILGVLPGGSGNDFFKMLGNNKSLESALKTAFLANPMPVDVGIVNGRSFFNAVGVGFDAYVAARAAQQKSISGFWSYLLAVFRVWRKFKPLTLSIELDQLKIEQDITLVCIGNGRSTGGGFYLTPTAIINDGLFDICIIQGLSKTKIFQILPRTLKGTHVRLEGVRAYRSRRIIIRSKERFPVHIDGEIPGDGMSKLEITVDSRKLKVAVGEKFSEA
jgi:YegS/Rv2252/BmrU family lipid kinase